MRRTIKEVAEVNPKLKNASKLSPDQLVSFIPMAAVSEITQRIETEEKRKFGEVSKGYTPFQKDDVLIAKITPCFENGKIALADIEQTVGLGSTEFHVIRANQQLIYPLYLYHLLRQEQIISIGKKRMTGSAGQKRLPAIFLEELSIPVPPLAEQKRIAAILDQADALRVKRRAALARLDALVHAVFLEMFGDPVTNPMGWEEVKLSETFKSKPQIGTAVPAHEGGKQIIVRVGELGKDYVAISDCKLVTLDGPELEKFSVKAGDYLLARAIGSEDHLGKASLMHNVKLPVVYDSHVMRLRFDSKTLLPQFFLVWMKSQGGRRRFMQRAARTAVQFNINTKQISDIDIPLPPIDKQANFVNFYNGAQAQQKRHENALQLAEKLFHALQQRAFRGEL